MKRRCPFCVYHYDSKLKRHIKRKHRDKEEVKNALKLAKKDQDTQFKSFINQGILITNKEEAGKENPLYERKRRTDKTESLVMCGECCIFISPTSMSNHTKLCSGKKNSIDVRLLTKPSEETSGEFKCNVIATLRNDSIGILCKTDRTILLCGYWSYQKLFKACQPDRCLSEQLVEGKTYLLSSAIPASFRNHGLIKCCNAWIVSLGKINGTKRFLFPTK